MEDHGSFSMEKLKQHISIVEQMLDHSHLTCPLSHLGDQYVHLLLSQ